VGSVQRRRVAARRGFRTKPQVCQPRRHLDVRASVLDARGRSWSRGRSWPPSTRERPGLSFWRPRGRAAAPETYYVVRGVSGPLGSAPGPPRGRRRHIGLSPGLEGLSRGSRWGQIGLYPGLERITARRGRRHTGLSPGLEGLSRRARSCIRRNGRHLLGARSGGGLVTERSVTSPARAPPAAVEAPPSRSCRQLIRRSIIVRSCSAMSAKTCAQS
jgi:hypothetical protein